MQPRRLESGSIEAVGVFKSIFTMRLKVVRINIILKNKLSISKEEPRNKIMGRERMILAIEGFT